MREARSELGRPGGIGREQSIAQPGRSISRWTSPRSGRIDRIWGPSWCDRLGELGLLNTGENQNSESLPPEVRNFLASQNPTFSLDEFWLNSSETWQGRSASYRLGR